MIEKFASTIEKVTVRNVCHSTRASFTTYFHSGGFQLPPHSGGFQPPPLSNVNRSSPTDDWPSINPPPIKSIDIRSLTSCAQLKSLSIYTMHIPLFIVTNWSRLVQLTLYHVADTDPQRGETHRLLEQVTLLPSIAQISLLGPSERERTETRRRTNRYTHATLDSGTLHCLINFLKGVRMRREPHASLRIFNYPSLFTSTPGWYVSTVLRIRGGSSLFEQFMENAVALETLLLRGCGLETNPLAHQYVLMLRAYGVIVGGVDNVE